MTKAGRGALRAAGRRSSIRRAASHWRGSAVATQPPRAYSSEHQHPARSNTRSKQQHPARSTVEHPPGRSAACTRSQRSQSEKKRRGNRGERSVSHSKQHKQQLERAAGTSGQHSRSSRGVLPCKPRTWWDASAGLCNAHAASCGPLGSGATGINLHKALHTCVPKQNRYRRTLYSAELRSLGSSSTLSTLEPSSLHRKDVCS